MLPPDVREALERAATQGTRSSVVEAALRAYLGLPPVTP
jgi:hypothetical protein